MYQQRTSKKIMNINSRTANLLTFLLATILWLAAVANAQTPAGKQAQAPALQAGSTSVTGSGMAGRLSKWTGVAGVNTFTLGDSIIFEDKFGKVGIGTDTPASKLTVAGMIETTLGGLKFPDGTVQTTAFNPSQVVRSLNGLQGDLFLAAGANITVTPSGGNTLTIAAPNALTGVAHNATLTGNGTAAAPLGIANGGVDTAHLANNAVTAAKIAPGNVVKSLNGLKDEVTLAAGPNITLTPVGNTLTIASTVANPDQNAFQRTYEVHVDPNQGNFGADVTIHVPAGKRLVIEYMSITEFGDGDFQLMIVDTTVAGVASQYKLALPKDGGVQGVQVDKQVRIYSDTNINLEIVHHNGGDKVLLITVSGHLVDLP
jgi:hypothetical protein